MFAATHQPASAPGSEGTSVWRSLAIVCAVAMVLRVVLVIVVANVGLVTDDERDYTGLAASIEEGRGFTSTFGPTSIRPPLYPAFVAGVWKLTGTRSLSAVRGAQIALSLVTIFLVFVLAREMFTEQIALIAATAWAFYPSFLYANLLLLTEVLFTVLVLGACLAASRLIRNPQHGARWAATAGLCVGLGALTRSVLFVFPLLLLPILAWLAGGSWRNRGRIVMAAALGYVVVVAPWSIRNTRLHKTVVVVDTMGGMNLRMGNFEYTLEDRMWDGVSLKGEQAWSYAMVQEHPDASHWTEGQRDKWARQAALRYMTQHPLTTLRRAVLKFADFWGLEREYIAAVQKGLYPAPRWFHVLSSGAVLGVYVATMLLAALGLLLIERPTWRHHAVPVAIVVAVCGLHSIVFGHSRYHLPLMPILTIYAAAAVANRGWVVQPAVAWRRPVAGVAVTVLIAVWTHEVFFRDGDRIRQLLAAWS
jgi:4-amino-4-deoxy-L-arabinose transferase-like glycosyltransferase